MTKRERPTFTEDFKQEMVQLYQNGKPRKEIIREYNLTPSSLDKWVSQSQNSGSFKEKDNPLLLRFYFIGLCPSHSLRKWSSVGK